MKRTYDRQEHQGLSPTVLLVVIVMIIILIAGFVEVQRTFFTDNTPLPSAHQARINKIESMGFSPELANYVASSNASLIQSNDTLVHFLVSFPSNFSADVSYKLAPNQTALPTPAELSNSTNGVYNVTVSATNSSSAEIITLSYYFVNVSSLSSTNSLSIPAEIFFGFTGASSAALSLETASRLYDTMNSGPPAQGASTVLHVLEQIKVGLDTVQAIGQAVVIYHEFNQWYDQLLSLENCAVNPTNPVTINGYQQDPGQEQRILDAIDAAKLELQELSIARLINLAVGLGSDLVPSKLADVASFLAGNYSEGTLKDLSQEIVQQIQNLVTPCKTSSTSSTTSTTSYTTTLTTTSQSTPTTMTFTTTSVSTSGGNMTFTGHMEWYDPLGGTDPNTFLKATEDFTATFDPTLPTNGPYQVGTGQGTEQSSSDCSIKGPVVSNSQAINFNVSAVYGYGQSYFDLLFSLVPSPKNTTLPPCPGLGPQNASLLTSLFGVIQVPLSQTSSYQFSGCMTSGEKPPCSDGSSFTFTLAGEG